MLELPTIQADSTWLGMYIHIDLSWWRHKFIWKEFKITTEAELADVRSYGSVLLRWNPDKSDSPRNLVVESGSLPPAPIEALPVAATPRLGESRRDAHSRVTKAFHETVKTVTAINRSLFVSPKQTLEAADVLVTKIVEALLSAPEVALQIMADTANGEGPQLHSLNVSVLAMLIGRQLRLTLEQCKQLGLGGLFHDIGLMDVDSKILMKSKTSALTKAESTVREQHCQHGLAIAQKVNLDKSTQAIIYCHHENMDGTGYPRGLEAEAIPRMARIITVANAYDNIVNPVHSASAVTPYAALSKMYRGTKGRYDEVVLKALIRCLGVYPPGSVVKLSDNRYAVVIGVNVDKPLKPTVLVYGEGRSQEDAETINLEETSGLAISESRLASSLPRVVVEFLCPTKRLSLYFDATQNKRETPRE